MGFFNTAKCILVTFLNTIIYIFRTNLSFGFFFLHTVKVIQYVMSNLLKIIGSETIYNIHIMYSYIFKKDPFYSFARNNEKEMKFIYAGYHNL